VWTDAGHPLDPKHVASDGGVLHLAQQSLPKYVNLLLETQKEIFSETTGAPQRTQDMKCIYYNCCIIFSFCFAFEMIAHGYSDRHRI
jgi:hypothetical protein